MSANQSYRSAEREKDRENGSAHLLGDTHSGKLGHEISIYGKIRAVGSWK